MSGTSVPTSELGLWQIMQLRHQQATWNRCRRRDALRPAPPRGEAIAVFNTTAHNLNEFNANVCGCAGQLRVGRRRVDMMLH